MKSHLKPRVEEQHHIDAPSSSPLLPHIEQPHFDALSSSALLLQPTSVVTRPTFLHKPKKSNSSPPKPGSRASSGLSLGRRAKGGNRLEKRGALPSHASRQISLRSLDSETSLDDSEAEDSGEWPGEWEWLESDLGEDGEAEEGDMEESELRKSKREQAAMLKRGIEVDEVKSTGLVLPGMGAVEFKMRTAMRVRRLMVESGVL